MRTSLIVLGVIFLVIGVVLYVYPSQTFSAQTTTGKDNPVNSSANLQVPVEWAYALSIIGLVFLFFGSVTSSQRPIVVSNPPPVTQTHTTITGPRGPRGSKGIKGSKGTKGKTRSALDNTVEVSVVRKNLTKRGAYPKSSVTTTTTRSVR